MKIGTHRRRARLACVVAGVAALATVLGACSSSGGSGSPGSAAANPSASTAPDATAGSSGSSTGTPSGSPINLAIVAELSGAQASIGGPWKQGAEQAAAEINKAGGILGHPVKTFTADTQSDTAKSAAAIRFALTKKPFAVIGPVLSDSIVVDAKITEAAKVPEFVGGIVDSVTQQGNPWIFRTNPSSSQESQVNAKFLADNIKAKKVALVYRNDERGQSANAALTKYLKGYNVAVSSIAVSPSQSNYAGLPAKVSQTGADAIYLSAIDTQDAQIISALNSAGNKLPITGDTEALSSTVSKLTHNASNGVRGVVDYSPAAEGFKELAEAYSKANGDAPTAQFYKAYIAVWQIKYALEKAGNVSQQALADALHGQTYCVSKYPRLLQSFYWGKNGDPDGQQYVAEVKDGQQVVAGIVQPLDESKFASCQ